MTKPDHNHDYDHPDDHDHANDNKRAVAPAPAGGALASLAALSAALNNVDTASVSGRSGKPMLQFKSREDNGVWMFGQKRTVVENNSLWALNPLTFRRGFICFSNDNKVIGERLAPISQPMPDITELPDKGGSEWQEQWAVDVKCITGVDAGTEAIFKPTTVGGIQVIAGTIETVRDRLNGGQHDGKVAPIVRLEKASYQHGQYGRVWTPVLTIVDWMSLDGPAPAPAPASPPPPAEQPRRRRVA
jgi:hypothetical protein